MAVLLITVTAFAFLLSHCDTAGPAYDPIEITGQVLDADTDEPISDAAVRLVEPKPEKTTVTDENGRFFFELDVDSTVNVRVLITKESYETIALETVAIPERNISFPTSKLSIEREDTDDPPVDEPDIESGGPFSLVLSNVSSETISVKGTGDAEQAEFVFQVKDSVGVSVPNAEVDFLLGSSPDGGEVVYPESSVTDSNGEVKTTLTSGTVSGVVQVIARIERDGFTVESRPVRITIQSGLPDENHFTLKSPNPSTISQSETSEIAVLLGDQYGNPVAEGTSVYFTTTGGVIDASAKTDGNGEATVALRYGDPIPENGRAVITVKTVGENNQSIESQTEVLFVSQNIQIQATPDAVRLANLSGMRFNYSVSDDRGNPLPEGTNISVSADGLEVDLSGDYEVTLGNVNQPGPGNTEFSFQVLSAERQDAYSQRDRYLRIDVNSSVGEKTYVIPVNDEPGGAASIVLSSITLETITVKETGGEEQTDFIFMVKDSAGTPVHDAEVAFDFGSSPDGGESLYPPVARTNNSGEVKTTLTSGTRSGVVQVIATIQRDGFTVKSRPVRVAIQSGLPSFDHFTIYRPLPQNLQSDIVSQISVMLGDQYGNPVAQGTRVYFTTTGGVIDASAVTNDKGRASVELQYGSPIPADGIVTLTAQTVDQNNQSIERQATVLFNQPPIVIEVNPTEFDIELLSDQTFNYSVTDANGNPLPEGSVITVTVEAEDIEVIGDINTVLGDHITGGQGITEFSFNVAGVNEEEHLNTRPVFIQINAQTLSGESNTVQIQGRKAKEVMH